MYNSQKPSLRTQAEKDRQQAVLDRMQRDLEGYVDYYQGILDKRLDRFSHEVLPYWQHAADRIQQELMELIQENVDAQRVPITWLPINKAKYRNIVREIERLTVLAQQMFLLAGQPEKLQNNLAYTYTDSYYFHSWGLEQATRLALNVPQLTETWVMGILANPWLTDGKIYSDRIRANTAFLAEKVRRVITDAVNMGWEWNKTARYIQDIAGEGYQNSVRLARTEMNRVSSQASSHVFMQNADILDGKRWRATLDARTAPKDAANDGKVFDLAYDTQEMPGIAGVRIPNHANCRCKYSPVVSGVSPKIRERIARGDGDQVNNFGERTYTKASNYREYAKQRGIDLDERLRNDDPRRYLNNRERNGLPDSTYKKVGNASVVNAASANLDSFAAKVKDRIAVGINSEKDLREIGGMVAEELNKQLPSEVQDWYKKYIEIRKTVRSLVQLLNKKAANNEFDNEYDQEYERWKVARTEQLNYMIKMQQKRAPTIRDVLARIRPMGKPDEGINWHAGNNKGENEARAAVEHVANFLPTEWLQKSNSTPMQAGKEKRGYYEQAYGSNGNIAKIVLNGTDEIDLHRVAFHEMGHRFEDQISGISKYEQEFYLRRTAGESLKWMGAGYRKDEVSRKDNFLDIYMGKDYSKKQDGRSKYYELLSMGIEGLYSGNYDLDADTDFRDFILGVLTSL